MTSFGEPARRAVAELDTFREALLDESDFENVIDAYLRLRSVMARSFRQLAELHATMTPSPVGQTVQAIGAALEHRVGTSAPAEHLKVASFGTIHSVLLSYLMRHVGEPVSADRLRVLTGDQVHTERRVRDLRKLGYTIEAVAKDGKPHYVLGNVASNIVSAARNQFEKNLNGDRSLDSETRDMLLARFDGEPPV